MTKHTVTAGAVKAELELDGNRLVSVTLPKDVPDDFDAPALSTLLTELAKYSIDLSGAPAFRRRVWERMREIPLGSAMTYGELAASLGNPGAVRAVGTACATNQLPIIVPCHRVLAESGPGGFALGLSWKYRLLELEIDLAAAAT